MRKIILLGAFILLLISMHVFSQTANGQDSQNSGFPVFTSWVQERYTDFRDQEDRWSLRRLKLITDGKVDDRLDYHMQFIYQTNNGSSSDDNIHVQDAYVRFRTSDNTHIFLGRFKPPFGMERFQSADQLDIMERTSVTNRLVPNGKIGNSYTRDEGVQADYSFGPAVLSTGIFKGAGAGNARRGNGPLVVARIAVNNEWKSGKWPGRLYWGSAISDRQNNSMDFHSVLPGVPESITEHFAGRDRRADIFARFTIGPLGFQTEALRARFDPDFGKRITAQGEYLELFAKPVSHLLLAARWEHFRSDIHDDSIQSAWSWTFSATGDFCKDRLRLQLDYTTSPAERYLTPDGTWRLQVQYVLFKSVSHWK